MKNIEDIQAELAKLKAENEALKSEKKQASREISFKIGGKGGLSVYGLGRFPVTLYKEQWLRLLDKQDEIRTYLKDHEEELKTKE